jgi:serine/threonine protein kinase/CheY-like chemotaxis protein
METTQVREGVSREDLIQRLQQSKLLSAEEIDRTCGPAMDAATDGRGLADSLVAAGVLTRFQIEAVCARRYADLRVGNYDILDRLGAGGMGTVFKARHRRMKRVVALKVLSQNLSRDETFVQRFQREVEAIARLTHPNIVMAYDADESDAGHFLVMEYVNGHDLASVVQRQGPLALPAAVSCLLQAARGLEYAHRQGIIHRDVKPANLLRDAVGVVKVTDMGLARFSSAGGGASSGTGGLTQAGGMLGTVDYMPPEQALDATRIDHRADIYSLGASLHYLLLGQPPYQAQTIMATLLKHRDGPIPSLVKARGDVPPQLDALFQRMMAKAPADRPQTMAEVVQALEAIQTTVGEVDVLPAPGSLPGHEALVGLPTAARPPLDATIAAGPAVAGQTIDLGPRGTDPGKPLSVVLVEPSRTQSGIIRKYLQAAGVEHVVTAASGREALAAVRSDRPHAVVSAMHLADMTGTQLAQQIRGEDEAGAPGFVLISSESEGKEAALLSRAGHAVVLHKPFTPEQLEQALSLASRRFLPLRAPAAAVERGKLRVLIVDDSATARMRVRAVLSGLGFAQFVEAADGAQAVAALVGNTFDLIVTDYNMPHMDGRGLVGYLKQNPSTAAVPIIMVTTETDPAKLEAVRRLGVAAVCDKHFDPEAIRQILDRLVVHVRSS